MENEYYYVRYIRLYKGVPSEDVRTFSSLKDLSEWLTRSNELTQVYGAYFITSIEKAEEP